MFLHFLPHTPSPPPRWTLLSEIVGSFNTLAILPPPLPTSLQPSIQLHLWGMPSLPSAETSFSIPVLTTRSHSCPLHLFRPCCSPAQTPSVAYVTPRSNKSPPTATEALQVSPCPPPPPCLQLVGYIDLQPCLLASALKTLSSDLRLPNSPQMEQPAVPSLPSLFQDPGWVPSQPDAVCTWFCLFSNFSFTEDKWRV